MKRIEPWWVCDKCGKKLSKVGKSFMKEHLKHLKLCPNATYCIKQLEQHKMV